MREKNRAMELYRFVCAVLILCYHCYFFGFRGQEDATFVGFYLFVELYFILSGFLMLRSIRTHVTPQLREDAVNTTVHYMKRHWLTLYPHHLLSWILVALVLVFVTKEMHLLDLIQIGWTELLLVNIFGFVRGLSINIVCWYLSALLFASLGIYYLLLKNEDAFLKIIAPILLVVLYGTLFDRKGSLSNTILFTQYAPFLGFYRAVADITVGCIAYRVYEWMEDVEIPGEPVLATVLELSIMAASWFWMYKHGGAIDFLFVVLFFTFVISVFRGKSLFSRLFDNRLSAWLGKQSYAFYLNNLVVVFPCLYLFPDITLNRACLICIPACFVLSVITTALVDLLVDWRKERSGDTERL